MDDANRPRDLGREGRRLPPAPHLCQACGRDHLIGQPHDAASLYYQYWFYKRNGRWPTWLDALAHVEPNLRAQWVAALSERGVDVAAGQLLPEPPSSQVGHGTSGGVEVDDAVIERLADQARRGLDHSKLKPRGRKQRSRDG